MFKIFERSEAKPCLTARFSEYSSPFASIQFRHPIHILQLHIYLLHITKGNFVKMKAYLQFSIFAIRQSVIFFRRHNRSLVISCKYGWNETIVFVGLWGIRDLVHTITYLSLMFKSKSTEVSIPPALSLIVRFATTLSVDRVVHEVHVASAKPSSGFLLSSGFFERWMLWCTCTVKLSL